MNETNTNEKSAAVAYLLWFFLGGFGAHRFYLGRTGSGAGMLGLFIGSTVGLVFLIGVLGFVALSVWWLVDVFLIGKWLNDESPTIAGTLASSTSSDQQQAA